MVSFKKVQGRGNLRYAESLPFPVPDTLEFGVFWGSGKIILFPGLSRSIAGEKIPGSGYSLFRLSK